MVLAENLAGTEENFALRMTSKAHALGMSQTVFHNASGLPDPDQVTTARDMSTLALSLLHHYPHYYHYFSVREFYYSGRPIANHNRLLGVYEGVDGIKTGYTRAAGFNLVASAQRGDRRLIGVVLGAPTSPVRNAMMADLFDQAFRGDQQIQLASISYYLNGGSALARNNVAGEIASARRQVAYAAPAVMSPRVATASKSVHTKWSPNPPHRRRRAAVAAPTAAARWRMRAPSRREASRRRLRRRHRQQARPRKRVSRRQAATTRWPPPPRHGRASTRLRPASPAARPSRLPHGQSRRRRQRLPTPRGTHAAEIPELRSSATVGRSSPSWSQPAATGLLRMRVR